MPLLSDDKKLISFIIKDQNVVAELTRLFPSNYYHTQFNDDKYTLTFPFTNTVTQTLTRAGVHLTGYEPIRHRFDWPKLDMKHEMFPHQRDMAAFMIDNMRCFNLSEPRTGKTLATIAAGEYLLQTRETGGVLIFTPLSCVRSVWLNALRGTLPHRVTNVVFGTKQSRLKALNHKSSWVIMNHDSIARSPDILEETKRLIIDRKINVLVIDESTELGNTETQRWQAIYELSKMVKYLWLLTGTPGGPMTVHGQALLKDDAGYVPVSRDAWRLMTMYVSHTYSAKVGTSAAGNDRKFTVKKYEPLPDASEKIEIALTPSIRVRKRDVFKSLPDEVIIPRQLDLDKSQIDMLHALDAEKVMVFDGDLVNPESAAALRMKVLQIAAGVVYGENGRHRLAINHHLESLKLLLRESPNNKVIIYACHVELVEYIADSINKMRNDDKEFYTAKYIHGGVGDKTRAAIFDQFMTDPDLNVIVAHPRTVSYGVELGVASFIIFWGAPTVGTVVWRQAIERLYSSHQTYDKPAIYQFYTTKLERKIFETITSKDADEMDIANQFIKFLKSGDSFAEVD